MKRVILFILILTPIIFSYDNLSPSQVHARLVAGDSLQLLDVREVSEYQDGHMAEPAGMPIIVPANMPWSSGVLSANFDKLPKDIDIIVNCRSGGRSASASAFLESKGYTRIYNMTSGFNGWSYESRQGGFGDGSGAWVATDSITIRCSQEPTVAEWIFFGDAFPNVPHYIELHKVLPHNSPFENLSENAFLYYTIVLDDFGLPVFHHFLDLQPASVELVLYMEDLFGNTQFKVYFFSSSGEWLGGDEYNGNTGLVSSSIYRWYRIESNDPDHIVVRKQPTVHSLFQTYPNPFNGQLKIDAPTGSQISIYNVYGKCITPIKNNIWKPDSHIGSGLYFVQMTYLDKVAWKKVVYQK